MANKVIAAFISCCCLLQTQVARSEQERPIKPVKVEEQPAQDHGAALPTTPPRPVNPLERLKPDKPKEINVATKPPASPGPDLGLGCAKDE